MKQYIPSPSYVLEEQLLERNLELMRRVQVEADVQIILALKAFAMWRMFPKIGQSLAGATASSLYEARLIFEEMGVKAHTYCVAYQPEDFEEIVSYSSHLTFNSIGQFRHYVLPPDPLKRERSREGTAINNLSKNKPDLVPPSGGQGAVSYGIRVNPEYSTVETDLYNPAAKGSRLGEPAYKFENGLPKGVEGLHFHTLCESSSYDLEKTLEVFEAKFSHLFSSLKWVNFGGGHLMTRADYDVPHLIKVLKIFKAKYPHLQVILEPGSAVNWQTGYLKTTILDIHESYGIKTVILDVSFTAHMPDTLEMPYRPDIRGAEKEAKEGWLAYRMGGVSCLAGDYLEAYYFEQELQIGDTIILEDMIHYTMVKTTMFNGVNHPSIVLEKADGTIEIVREFAYEDYKKKMG